VISKHEIPIQQRAEALIQMANANGGVDNITVELVEFAVGVQDINRPVKKKNNWGKMLLALALLVILGGLAWFIISKPSPKPNDGDNPIAAGQTDDITPDSTLSKSLVPEIRITYPVGFTEKGEYLFTELLESFDNDSIVKIGQFDKSIDSVKIKGNSIKAKWVQKPVKDTLTITCETTLYEKFIIKIPLLKKEMPITSDIMLDSIPYILKEDLFISIKGKKILLIKGEKKTNDKSVKCDVTDDYNIVIQFTKPEYPNSIEFSAEAKDGKKYRFIIPVKKPQKKQPETLPENSDHNEVLHKV